MKNKDFFYLQYDKINWQNQEKTKINAFVNNFIIEKIIFKHKGDNIKVFDIGFGIGFFLKMLYQKLKIQYKKIILAGCEPSEKNYNHFSKKSLSIRKGVQIKLKNSVFLKTKINEKFNFITAIYVFPHFISNELGEVVSKIHAILKENGKFILVVANEKYLKDKLRSMKDLFIEESIIEYKNKKYKEFLHYSDIPKIGKIIDYNREEKFYVDLFKDNRFKLILKKDLDDNGFICTVFVFQKKSKLNI